MTYTIGPVTFGGVRLRVFNHEQRAVVALVQFARRLAVAGYRHGRINTPDSRFPERQGPS